MGLPGTLGAPDQRYGRSGGYLGEGGDGLDSFFSAEDDAMERGHQGCLLSELAKALAKLEAATANANGVSTDGPSSEGGLGVNLNGRQVTCLMPLPKKPSALQYLWDGIKWAFVQTLTSGADPETLGAVGPPSSGASSINQMNKQINTGKAPTGITRIDKGKSLGEQTHAHFGDNHALNIDGSWKHEGIELTRNQAKFLRTNGWYLP